MLTLEVAPNLTILRHAEISRLVAARGELPGLRSRGPVRVQRADRAAAEPSLPGRPRAKRAPEGTARVRAGWGSQKQTGSNAAFIQPTRPGHASHDVTLNQANHDAGSAPPIAHAPDRQVSVPVRACGGRQTALAGRPRTPGRISRLLTHTLTNRLFFVPVAFQDPRCYPPLSRPLGSRLRGFSCVFGSWLGLSRTAQGERTEHNPDEIGGSGRALPLLDTYKQSAAHENETQNTLEAGVC